MGVLPILYFANRLSSTMMSGSGYRVGFLPDQSRSAALLIGASTAPAAAVAAAVNSVRRLKREGDAVSDCMAGPRDSAGRRTLERGRAALSIIETANI